MTTLHNFLAANTLIENTHDIFNYDIFATRFLARYGFQNIRADLTEQQIKQYAQNIVDVNQGYYQSIFNHVLDPFKTWGEIGDNNGTTTTENNGTETTDYTTAITGTITILATGNSTTNTENNGAENNFRNAYNAPETPTPTDNSTNSNTGINTNNYTDNNTNTQTNTTKNGGTKTDTNNGTTTTTNKDNKTGWNNSDALNTINNYLPAYDIIINDVAAVIIDVSINIWG